MTPCRCCSPPLLPLPLLLAGSAVYLLDDCFTSHILVLSSQLTHGGRHQAECPVLCDVTGAWGSEEQGCVGRWLSVVVSGISGVQRAWQPPTEWQLAAQECRGGSCRLTPGSSALELCDPARRVQECRVSCSRPRLSWTWVFLPSTCIWPLVLAICNLLIFRKQRKQCKNGQCCWRCTGCL